MRKAILSLAFALVAVGPAAAQEFPIAAPLITVDEVVERSFPLPAGGAFELTNINGSVRVEGWDQERVQIIAVKSSTASPNDLRRVAVDINTRQPGKISVQTQYPQDEAVEVTVEYRIRVPHRINLNHITTVNGGIRISGVDGTGDLRTVNGNVELLDSSGGFSARTTNGSVHLEYRLFESPAPVTVEAVNGVVVLALPHDTSAELDVASLNGDFASDLPLRRSSSGSREFRARLGRGGTLIKLRTVNGAIRVVPVQSAV